jgi:type I restriction enzyme S subunit
MARALYREWFVHFRYLGHESVPLVTSALGDVPQGWEIKELGDLFDFIGGSQPPKIEHAYEERAGFVRFIQNRDYGSSSHLTYIADSPRNKICERLDIMVDKYGEPGRTRFGLTGAYNVALAKILPHEPLHREWLRGLISEPDFNTYLAGASMAATRASLNSSHFIVSVAVPSAEVAQSFGAHVEPLLKLLLAHQESIANLRRTRDLLLTRLLSVQIDFSRQDEEGAV